MDPHLLLGLVNTELRNNAKSLEDLVKTHGLDQNKLIEKLRTADYEYQPDQKQFRNMASRQLRLNASARENACADPPAQNSHHHGSEEYRIAEDF